MPKVDVFMPVFGGDYLKDTTDLSTEEHGAYWLLLLNAWNRGGRLPNDPEKLARMAGLLHEPARWRKVWATIQRFWTVDGDEIFQGRQVRELARAQEQKEAATERARKANGARWGLHNDSSKDSSRIPQGVPAQSSPPPPPQLPPTATPTAPPTPAGETPARAPARDVGEDQGQGEAVDVGEGKVDGGPMFAPGRDHVGKPPRRLTDEELATLRPVAGRILDRWAKEAHQVDPKNPDLEPGAWSINRETWIGQLVPELERHGQADVEAAIPWAMADLGDDGWSGWRSVLDTPAGLIGALRRGSVVKQYRAAQQRGRENGHARRSTGPEPPDYAAAAEIRKAERERQEAELRAASKPSAEVREKLRRVAGGAGAAP